MSLQRLLTARGYQKGGEGSPLVPYREQTPPELMKLTIFQFADRMLSVIPTFMDSYAQQCRYSITGVLDKSLSYKTPLWLADKGFGTSTLAQLNSSDF